MKTEGSRTQPKGNVYLFDKSEEWEEYQEPEEWKEYMLEIALSNVVYRIKRSFKGIKDAKKYAEQTGAKIIL